jgi:hypothetical protein
LNVLKKAKVFANHESKVGAILAEEWTMGKVILDAGYSLDTILYMYQRVDWRNKTNWKCNIRRFVGREGGYAGINVHPFETLFIKKVWKDLDNMMIRWDETTRYQEWRKHWRSGGAAMVSDETYSTSYVSS